VKGRQATLAHEAGHVVGGLLAGHRIETVRLGPTKREPRNSGMTTFDWAVSSEVDLYGHLVAVLMGPMAAGKPPPVWPPLPDMDGNDDEQVVLTLVIHLKLTKPEYFGGGGARRALAGRPAGEVRHCEGGARAGADRFADRRPAARRVGTGLVEWLELGTRRGRGSGAAPSRQSCRLGSRTGASSPLSPRRTRSTGSKTGSSRARLRRRSRSGGRAGNGSRCTGITAAMRRT
jgi:hypothetical protein